MQVNIPLYIRASRLQEGCEAMPQVIIIPVTYCWKS
jgi:hypothetical protein